MHSMLLNGVQISESQEHLLRKLMVRWGNRWADSLRVQFLRWFETIRAQKERELRIRKAQLKSLCLRIFEEKQPGKRSPEETDVIKEYCKLLGFVTGMENHYLLALAQNLRAETFEVGELMFMQGSKGTDCYVVATGLVDLYKVETREQEIKLASVISSLAKQAVPEKILGEKIATCGEGTIFGELSLFTGKPRSTSAWIKNFTQVLVISQNLYKECFSENMAKRVEFNSRVEFLHQISPLSLLRHTPLQRLAHRLQLRHYNRGRWLARQGEPTDGILILVNGEVALLAKASVFCKRSPLNEKRKTKKAKRKPEILEFELRRLGRGCIIGHIEVIGGHTTYQYSLLANSDVECYWMAPTDFRETILGGTGEGAEAMHRAIKTLAASDQKRYTDQIHADSMKYLSLKQRSHTYSALKKKDTDWARLGGLESVNPAPEHQPGKTLHETFSTPLFQRTTRTLPAEMQQGTTYPMQAAGNKSGGADVGAGMERGHQRSRVQPSAVRFDRTKEGHEHKLKLKDIPPPPKSLFGDESKNKEGEFPALVPPGTARGSCAQRKSWDDRPHTAPEYLSGETLVQRKLSELVSSSTLNPVPILSKGLVRQDLALSRKKSPNTGESVIALMETVRIPPQNKVRTLHCTERGLCSPQSTAKGVFFVDNSKTLRSTSHTSSRPQSPGPSLTFNAALTSLPSVESDGLSSLMARNLLHSPVPPEHIFSSTEYDAWSSAIESAESGDGREAPPFELSNFSPELAFSQTPNIKEENEDDFQNSFQCYGFSQPENQFAPHSSASKLSLKSLTQYQVIPNQPTRIIIK